MIDGEVKGTPFTYLSHYSPIYPPPHNQESTLVDLIETISKHIHEYEPKDNQQKIHLLETTKLRLIVGGGVDDDNDLIREGLSLLNDNNINIIRKFENKEHRYLHSNLKGKVTIMQTITYPVPDEDEDKSK